MSYCEKHLAISKIEVAPDRLRVLRGDTVNELMESMAKLGQLQPIAVQATGAFNCNYLLVVGWHRLEAAKKLKWKSIRATVYNDMDADHAKLAEIDENLIRAELSPAERALHIDARKTLYEKANPETKHGKAPVGRGGKKEDAIFASSFVDDTAKKTGKQTGCCSRRYTRQGGQGMATSGSRNLAGSGLRD